MTWQQIVDLFGKGIPLSISEMSLALGFALLCSFVTVLMYNYFYGSENIGAGVQRSFLLLGPAITAVFLGIQFSLPLSLGLLGALSIIRFRTPVKDPAEIGFLMLLIAAAIGSATFNYLLVGILFLLVFITLMIVRLTRGYSGSIHGTLFITLNGSEHARLEGAVTPFVINRLSGAKLRSISSSAESTSLQYSFRKSARTEWAQFTSDLGQLAPSSEVNVFMG